MSKLYELSYTIKYSAYRKSIFPKIISEFLWGKPYIDEEVYTTYVYKWNNERIDIAKKRLKGLYGEEPNNIRWIHLNGMNMYDVLDLSYKLKYIPFGNYPSLDYLRENMNADDYIIMCKEIGHEVE